MAKKERGDPVEREAHRLGTAAQLDRIEREPSLFRDFIGRGRRAQAAVEQIVTAHARATDPETSHEAALAATIGLSEKQQAVYECLSEFGRMTDVDLVEMYHRFSGRSGVREWPQQSDSGIRTRRHELTDRTHALVVNDGIKKIGKRKHNVWRAVE